MAKIINLHCAGNEDDPTRLNDLPQMLRRLADDIAKGDPPDARNVIVAVECDSVDIHCYGFGPDAGDVARAVGLLELAKHSFMAPAEDGEG